MRSRGDGEKVSRGGFLRRAGVAGLALAGIGDLVAAPLASARTGRPVGTDMPPSMCNSYSVCRPCYLCCNGGQPCKPTGVANCFYCTQSACLSQGVHCIDYPAQTFHYCCN